jgi:hypothetical protein
MPLDLISLTEWLKLNERELNDFCSSCFTNNIKTNTTTTKRNITELIEIDREYLAKAYNSKSTAKIEEIRSAVKTDYLSKKFYLKYIDWYIVRPLGKNGNDSFQVFFPLYLPNTEALEQIKNYLIDFRQPCFNFDYISLTDMTDGKETILFLGAMNEAEPCCTNKLGHKWDWMVFREDVKEIYLAKCERCGIEKEAIIGDDRNHMWNKNHGWRYFSPTVYNKSPEQDRDGFGYEDDEDCDACDSNSEEETYDDGDFK